jgi:hypothetical protein
MSLIPGPNNELVSGSLPTQYGATSNYVQSSTGSIVITSSATTPANVVSVNITTTGNPVFVSCTGDANPATGGGWCVIQLYRNSTALGKKIQAESSGNSENVPYAINYIDNVAAGTYTYSLKVTAIAGSNFTFGEQDGPNLTVFEIR